MLKAAHVLGSRLDPEFSDKLHDLAHRDAIDTVVIAVADLARRRLLAKTSRGAEIAIALPRDERLFDGAVIFLSDEQAVIVKAAGERWLRCEPASLADAIELGYHAGNLHWRVKFEGNGLLVALEGRPEDYIARIEPMVSSARVKTSIIDESEQPPMRDPGMSHSHEHHGHHDHHHHHHHGVDH